MKNGDRASGNNSGGVVSLERAHVYSVDKQQVSIIQVGNDLKQQVPTSGDTLSSNSKSGLFNVLFIIISNF